jgi:hypothetical protein
MTQAIAQVLTDAVGVAISPVPVIAIVLMLFTARTRRNATARRSSSMRRRTGSCSTTATS